MGLQTLWRPGSVVAIAVGAGVVVCFLHFSLSATLLHLTTALPLYDCEECTEMEERIMGGRGMLSGGQSCIPFRLGTVTAKLLVPQPIICGV